MYYITEEKCSIVGFNPIDVDEKILYEFFPYAKKTDCFVNVSIEEQALKILGGFPIGSITPDIRDMLLDCDHYADALRELFTIASSTFSNAGLTLSDFYQFELFEDSNNVIHVKLIGFFYRQ